MAKSRDHIWVYFMNLGRGGLRTNEELVDFWKITVIVKVSLRLKLGLAHLLLATNDTVAEVCALSRALKNRCS